MHFELQYVIFIWAKTTTTTATTTKDKTTTKKKERKEWINSVVSTVNLKALDFSDHTALI